MVDMRGYSIKVRRSLLPRDLMAGIPIVGLVLILILGVVFIYVCRLYFMIVFIAILYIVMRMLTLKDSWLIDIMLETLQQKDVFIP